MLLIVWQNPPPAQEPSKWGLRASGGDATPPLKNGRPRAPVKDDDVKTIIKKRHVDQGPTPPPDMPQYVKSVIDIIGGTGIALIVQKRLATSDVDNHHNRLLIPSCRISNNTFLTNHEKYYLSQKKEKNNTSL